MLNKLGPFHTGPHRNCELGAQAKLEFGTRENYPPSTNQVLRSKDGVLTEVY